MLTSSSDANATILPEGLVPYKRTAEFTPETVPAGLRKDHCTKADVWALIHVIAGKLRYQVTDRRRCASNLLITSDTAAGIVEPTILHHVKPLEGCRFFVEFWRPPGA